MTPSLLPFWEAEDFHFRTSTWIREGNPDFDVVSVVVAWVARLVDNPYLGGGVRHLDVAPNLWRAVVPGTERDHESVFCSYWIDEEFRRVRCDQISTLPT